MASGTSVIDGCAFYDHLEIKECEPITLLGTPIEAIRMLQLVNPLIVFDFEMVL